MVVTGEPYNVLQERGNNAHGAEWHEYTCALVCDCGQQIDEWDSYAETYNGIQWLTRADCEANIRMIEQAVKAMSAGDWFSTTKCTACGKEY